MKRKFDKSEKIFLFVIGAVALLCVLLLIPAVQSLILRFAENVLLHRELRKPEKWVEYMQSSGISLFLGCLIWLALLLFDFKTVKIPVIPVIVFGIVLAFFSTDYLVEFATDTYATYETGLVGMSNWMIKGNGRLVIGLVYILFGKLGFSITSFYMLSYALAIINLSLSILILQKIIKMNGVKQIPAIICAFSFIVNPFVIEYFMFLEKGMFFLAVLLAVVGAYLFFLYLKNDGGVLLAVSGFVCLLFCVFTYQSVAALFVFILIPLIFKYSDSLKKYVLRVALIFAMYGVCGIANKLFTVFLKSTKVSYVNFARAIKGIVLGLPNTLIDTVQIVPKFSWLILFLMILSLSLLSSISKKSRARFWHILFLVSVSIFLPVTTCILTVRGVNVPRIIYPLGSCSAVLFFDYLINEKSIELPMFLPISFTIFLVIEFFSFQQILVDKQKVTALDRYRIEFIGQKINEYEVESGETIKSIAFYSMRDDEYQEYSGLQYAELFRHPGLVVSSFQTPWSNLSAINYFLGTSYGKADRQQKYIEAFKSNKATVLSNEQFIFDGDTLHLFVYQIP